MKNILLFLFLLTSTVYAQESTNLFPLDSTGDILYTGSGYAPDVAQNELYNRARLWVTTSYNSAKDVIQLDDRESGTIVVKGIIKTYLSCAGSVEYYENHTLKIQVKDGRYRYSITDITFTSSVPNDLTTDLTYKYIQEKLTFCKKGVQKMLFDVAQKNFDLITSLNTAMKKESDKW